MTYQIGDRRFIEIPGVKTIELPPLLFSSTILSDAEILELAEEIVQSDLLADSFSLDENRLEQANMDLAIGIAEQYKQFCLMWNMGDSIIGWISQCETTFRNSLNLCNLLKPDIWPHAGLNSFVVLLKDKGLFMGVNPENAVGTRRAYRQALPIKSLTSDFLYYLYPSMAETAYKKWAGLTPKPAEDLPPERFHFDVLEIN